MEEFRAWMKKILKSFLGIAAFSLAVAFIGLICFRIFFVNFVDNYELGYKYDALTGKMETLQRTGYFVTWPVVVKVHTIDLRPMQVRITSINRVLNAKLVQFNPKGMDLFLSWHGRGDYSISGAGGSNSSNSPSQFEQIMTAYAYEGSGKSYPFLEVIRELRPEEMNANPSAK